MPPTLLQRLKALQHQRSDISPFTTHKDFLIWVDEITPLLSFDPKLQRELSSTASAVDLRTKMRDVEYDIEGVNRCIGLLNQAITKQELQESSLKKLPADEQTSKKELEWPPHFTFRWLFDHAPMSFYGSLLTAVAVSFSLGIAVAELRTSSQSKPLSASEPTNIAPIKASAPLVHSATTSIITAFPASSSPAK